jgi:PKD repeat protein
MAMFLAVLIALMTGCGGEPVIVHSGSGTITLPSGQTYQSGASATVLLSGLTSTPTTGNLIVTLTPSAGGSPVVIAVQSVTAQGSGSYLVTFTIPSLSITATTQYTITITDSDPSNSFTTAGVTVTVQPGAGILSVSPSTAQAGSTVDVTIAGVSTAWASGATANFGAGVSVGGAAVGTAGPVTVNSGTQATAHLVVDLTASGKRDVIVTSGSQTLTLVGGFTVTAAPKPPVPFAGGPYTGITGQPVTFSAVGSSDPAGLALTYAWQFGDSGTGSGISPVHSYATAGKYTVTVTATNSGGVSASATSTATITDPAKPPVANAGGPYTGVAGTAVSFSGAGSSDPKGETLTYSWNFGDGNSGTGVAPTHTYTSAGTYSVALTVTNTDNLSSTATASAVVAAAPQPPVANAGGPYSGITGTAISFSGAASTDPKGEALTYSWSFGDGGTGTGVTTTHTYSTTGTFTATLTVTNTDNKSATATATVTVTAPAPPTANAGGPYNGTVNVPLQLSGGSSTDPKGETLTFAWNFGDGTTGAGVAPVHTYATSGTFTVTLKVTNTDNLSGTATATATIGTPGQVPVASAGGPYTGTTGTAVSFTAAGSSDPKGETLTYSWNFGDGATGSGVSTSHTYSTAGTYTVTLKVTNTDNLSSTATATAVISAPAQPPVANAGGPYSGTAGSAVAFTGQGSTDPKNETLTYAWNFGDGSTGSGATTSHTYANPGTFTVTLKVTNTDNLSNSVTTSATIAGVPPVANAGGPYKGILNTAVSFNGAGSSDPRGETLTYAWTFGDGSTGNGATPTHTYTSFGTFNVALKVTNTDSLSTTGTTTALISGPPVANAGGPYSGNVGASISFSSTGSSDPQNETLTYAWDFGDGGTATGASPTHIYKAAGKFTVTLKVTNTDNLSTSATATATISGVAPVANAGGPYTGLAGAAITFNGSASSDPNSETLTYAWSFGDGSTGTGAKPTHAYASGGTYTATLTVTNTDSLTNTATASVTINAPPVANAGGPYTGIAGTSVSFNGGGSTDPRGETLTYAWTFGDGGTGTGAAPSHTYTSPGTFTVTLTVTNTDSLTNTATTSATITAAPPVANAGGPYTGVAGAAVSFNGAASTDPHGETLTYAWSFGDGGTGTGATPTHTYTSPGTFTVTLTVTNTDNKSNTAATSATISAAPPVANAGGPYTGVAGTALNFNGGGSTDPAGETLTYAWNFGDGGTATGATPTHTYAGSGIFTVTLTVTNTDNKSNTATTSATISAAPQPPVANAGGSYTGVAGTAVSFNGSGSTDPKNETLTYAWNFGDGGTGTGATTTHTYASSGTFTVTLTVTNTDSKSDTATTSATISGAAQSPVANAGGPYTGTTGTAVSFTGAGSTDPKSETLTYAWNFGDGSTGTGITTTHTYATANTFTVTLTVTNTDSKSNTATTTATITSPAQPPVANVGGPYTGTVNNAVSFSGTGSTDPKSEALTYAWDFGDGSTGTGATTTHTYATASTFTVKLTVTNTDSLSNSATTTATITAGTQAPTANAGGPYTGSAGNAVSFSGTGSTDPKGETLTYAWNFGDGATGSGATTTHTYANSGTFTVSLTVTNTDSLSNTATTTATISGAAQPPVSIAGGPYTGTTGNAVTFSGAGSTDPKSETLSYAWNFGDGATGSGVTTTHTYTNAGNFTVTLTVTNTDSLSNTSSTTAAITSSAPQKPSANPGGPYTGTAGIAVSFNGTGSSDPVNPGAGPFALTFSWSFGDSGTGVGATPSHTYTSAGTYTVSLTVQSASGQTMTATTTANIGATATLGVPTPVPGGPYSGLTSTAVSFNGSASTDPNNATLTYHWSFGDGSSADGVTVSHTYGVAGMFNVELSVFNGTTGNSATTTATITGATTPALTVNPGGPYTVALNQPLTVDGSGTNNPNNRQMTFNWDFGDGSTGTGVQAIHVYAASGSYNVTLTASDPTGLSGSASAAVTVTGPPAEAVTANAGGPYNDVTSHAITFDASASIDNLSNPLTYTWDFGDGNTGSGVNATHAYASKGTYTATVTASSGTASATATAQVTITNALQVSITSPAANAMFGTTTTTVSGTLSAPNLTVTVNGIAAQVSGTSFTATGVSLREGVNLISATATDGAGGVGTGVVSVVMDATAPTVAITSPSAGASVTNSTLSVAGLVNDIVSGTVGSNDVTVTVNGVAAQVANRSFLLPSLLLAPGANTLTVVATDKVGNTSTTTQTVQYVPPTRQMSLVLFSGDGQTGASHALLPQPLVVQLLSADGTPVVGRPVTFTVTRSDGMVEILPNIAQSLYVNTDVNGKASVLFQLGARSGLGINQVTASTPGAAGTVLFVATSTTGTPTQIHAVTGENQRGLLGEPLPEAFQVIVQDGYGNPVQNATVNYTSTGGDGTLDHSSTTTDSNGRALATLTLGQQEGVGNYMVTADFQGDTGGTPATFAASGYAPGPVSNTSISGVVLDNANTPIPNATVRIQGTTLSTVSDTNGHFMITGAPVGTVTFSVDGSTSTRTETFPFLSFVLEDLPGQNNTLNKPVYLPTIDVDNGQTVGGDDPVTLTMTGVPGVAFTVAPHSVTFPDGSTVGKLSLSQVKSDMVPMEPSNGSGPDLIWTLQPAGTRFSVPVQVTVPNTQGLAPGTVSEIYQYDHDLEQFVSAGTGHVSADGSVIVSDPGFGITKAGWGHGFNVPLPTNCPVSCDDHNECTDDHAGVCNCSHIPRNGAACGSKAANSCQLPGVCIGAYCSGKRKNPGFPCDDGQFCTTDDKCTNDGACIGTPKPDITGLHTPYPDAIKFEKAFESGVDPLAVFINTYGYYVKLEPVINPEFNQSRICCEDLKIDDALKTQSKLTVGLKVSTAQIPIPGATYKVPFVGGVFVYIQFAVTASGFVAYNTDQCAGTACVTGGVGLEGTIELGLKTELAGFSVSGGGQAGITANITVGCHAAIFAIGSTDAKAVFAIGAPNGKTYSFEKVIIPATALGQALVPLGQ